MIYVAIVKKRLANFCQPFLLIFKCSVLAVDGKVSVIGGFDAADDLGIDAERTAYVDNLLGVFLRQVDFKAVTAVEYLVHLLPISVALLLDCAEQGRDGEHVVFYHMYILYKVQNLGLGAA